MASFENKEASIGANAVLRGAPPMDHPIPVLDSLAALREWRQNAFSAGKSVGFVPTMGALHDGHMALVRKSLEQNDLTVVSIFVNPAQFAPHEDLATYPRTLDSDLQLLSSISTPALSSSDPAIRSPSAVFVPQVKDMYPSGIVQDIDQQKGTFVEVKGFGHQMEGQSRPTFFRGVATVVTKLFNAVQPTNAYFGQKDIQQGLLLKKLVKDLLMFNPTPDRLHIVPTHRCPDGLALSSRNAYLTSSERTIAPTLFAALQEAERAWLSGCAREECVARAKTLVNGVEKETESKGVSMRLDYIEMNDPETFEILDDNARYNDGKPVVLSGALWVGKTRLIDNLLLGDFGTIM